MRVAGRPEARPHVIINERGRSSATLSPFLVLTMAARKRRLWGALKLQVGLLASLLMMWPQNRGEATFWRSFQVEAM